MALELKKIRFTSRKNDDASKSNQNNSIGGLLTFAVVVVAMIFVMSVFFRVSDIQVEGNRHYTDEEIIKAVNIEEGDNLFFFDQFAAVARANTKLPYIEQVSVTRSLPNRVMISVVECEAMAYLELGDEQWTLDHSCKILGKAAEGELGNLIPILGISPGTLMIGEKLETSPQDDELVAEIAEILAQIQDRGLTSYIRRVDFSDSDHVTFAYGDRFTVRLGKVNNIEHKFGMFVTVMGKLKSGDVGIIDVSDGNTAHFIPN